MVALICQALALDGGERVLDVGTGSGYAGGRARRARRRGALDRADPRARRGGPGGARGRRATSASDVHVGDGSLGLPEHAPFDGDRRRRRGAEVPRGALGAARARAAGSCCRSGGHAVSAACSNARRTARAARSGCRPASCRSSGFRAPPAGMTTPWQSAPIRGARLARTVAGSSSRTVRGAVATPPAARRLRARLRDRVRRFLARPAPPTLLPGEIASRLGPRSTLADASSGVRERTTAADRLASTRQSSVLENRAVQALRRPAQLDPAREVRRRRRESATSSTSGVYAAAARDRRPRPRRSSFVVSAASNYWWNRHWTFADAKGHFGYQGMRFFVVSPAAFWRQPALALRLPRLARLGKIVSQAIAIVLVTPLNFLGNKLWSFRR